MKLIPLILFLALPAFGEGGHGRAGGMTASTGQRAQASAPAEAHPNPFKALELQYNRATLPERSEVDGQRRHLKMKCVDRNENGTFSTSFTYFHFRTRPATSHQPAFPLLKVSEFSTPTVRDGLPPQTWEAKEESRAYFLDHEPIDGALAYRWGIAAGGVGSEFRYSLRKVKNETTGASEWIAKKDVLSWDKDGKVTRVVRYCKEG